MLVIFAILNSSLANANAGANASTRVIFALGRARLLPRWFAAIHETYRTPMNAVHFQGILGIDRSRSAWGSCSRARLRPAGR